MRVTEPAADLAVAAALVSAREDAALPIDAVIFGEISLSGALRPVSQAESRLKEAQKLGFCQALLPASKKVEEIFGITVRPVTDLASLVEELFGSR